jgi:hypothetical protein
MISRLAGWTGIEAAIRMREPFTVSGGAQATQTEID